MSAPKVLVRDESPSKRPLAPAPDFGWHLLGSVGFVFAVVGGMDFLLTWYPVNFGSPEWEFGTITASFDGLPLLVIGLALLLGSGVAQGRRWLVRVMAVTFLVLAVVIVLAAVLYATNVPIALKSISDPVVRLGLKKAIAKTAGQAIVYPCAFVWLALKGWRYSKSG